MPGWVTLDEFANELDVAGEEDAEDLAPDEAERLQRNLDAAQLYIERIHHGRYNFTGAPSTLPAPGEDLKLGTLLLARRWNTRRRSPAMLVAAADQGAARVPFSDPDIERLCRIGRHAIPRVG